MTTGVVCSLTNAKPEFIDKCESYSLDEEAAKKELARQQREAQVQENDDGFFATEKKGLKKGVLGGVAMIAIALVWFFVGLAAGRIFFYPPVLLVIGIVSIVKGAAEGNLAGEKYKKNPVNE